MTSRIHPPPHNTQSPQGKDNFDSLERICNLVPSTKTDSDWVLSDALACNAIELATPPPSVDLRENWWDVGDQEDTGSCVGWATADGLLRYQLVKANRLSKGHRLSPRYVWMASKETDAARRYPETFIEDSSTSLKAAVALCKTFGVVTEDLLPFHIGRTMYLGDESAFFTAAFTRRAASYFNMRRDQMQWKHWLANIGPVLVGLRVDATWDQVGHTGELNVFQPDTVRGGHAVTLVGYREDGRFIVRNSWGAGWGDGGFAYAGSAYIEQAFFDESYGVTI
ncbi:C1 family peptidase [Rhodococcus sp. T2V]|uniref:C1 family peptidase n=1 Tax=Rhodococcus sp. T2V TaxID=3034164 RepID=UPI0023E3200E|nr:C1 family peptidase [Rhodococcus sp. T2V]MDF3311624.1 C1 family peptidase [Rhodococcus sp. T2V]